MKSLSNDLVLRPRFQHHLNTSKDIILDKFEEINKHPFLVNRIDDHLFIKFEQGFRTLWTYRNISVLGSDLGLALCLWQNRKKKRRAPNEGALFFYIRGHQPLIIDCIQTVLIG